ncbi:head GIN domain-containing protein [Flammeovirga sp. EKP202]|uniref:head GIN domain-containing protein n=1 Tax=Flammeovirga sp. EKP202 TaxID=2770592 RepID=UPI00165ED3F2|nr:head GIN domain-containing protein [Flammeovirga sp. EKP202]MBD0402459.1 DUF2807 domain-containing protein [Flammeovirga sp. EKP202]
MKTKLFILSIAILFSSFVHAQETDTRSLGSFEGIKISGSMDVKLISGKKNEAVVHLYGSTKPTDVITEVSGGKLSIRPKKGVRNVRADIEITYSDKINSVSFSGSSDIVCKGKVLADNLTLAGSGSGSFTGEVNVDELKASLSGSGELDLKGKADNFSISVSGSADIDAKDMESKIVTISVSGSGDVDCWATEEINARVSGSGDIRYKGTPERTKIKVSGSGDISQFQ